MAPHHQPPSPAAQRDELASTRALAKVLDDLVTIPGTNIGIGLDSVIGLVPGIGDGAGVVLSGAVLVQAIRQGVPLPVLGRMVLNLGIDAGLGLIPGVGDLADVAHRANRKNVRLLQAVVADPTHTKRTSTAYLVVAGVVVGLTLLALAALAMVTIWLLWQVLSIKI